MPRPALLLTAGLVAVALAAGACRDDAEPRALATPTTAEPTPRPAGLEEVRQAFSAELDELGMVLTDEGGVIDLDTYEPAPEDGTHLSIYLAPRTDQAPEAYLDGILDTARALAPRLFERWSAIETFDVCQLPPVDDEEGAALTRLDMDRAAVESLDWDALDLPAFLELAQQRTGDGIRLYVNRPLRETTAYQERMAAAGLS